MFCDAFKLHIRFSFCNMAGKSSQVLSGWHQQQENMFLSQSLTLFHVVCKNFCPFDYYKALQTVIDHDAIVVVYLTLKTPGTACNFPKSVSSLSKKFITQQLSGFEWHILF